MADIITLPDYVEPCPYCNATGEAEQSYTRGCGMGYSRMMGSCPMCGKHESFGRPGPGYIYKATCEPVGTSVVAQIETMRSAHG